MGDQYTNEHAGRILSRVIGGTVVLRDIPGAPPGTHDFDLTSADLGTIAVEVTISTDRTVLEFWHAIHQQSWDTPQLRNSWFLNVAAPTRVKGLRGQIEPLLQGLERRGIEQFGIRRQADVPEVKQLHKLLIKSGGVLTGYKPSQIFMNSTGVGVGDINAVNRAIEHEAMKQDNRTKLGRAKANERHLFVWVDPLASHAAVAIGSMDVMLPASGCSLPPEIDAVWLATPGTDDVTDAESRLWRCDRHGWVRIPPSTGKCI